MKPATTQPNTAAATGAPPLAVDAKTLGIMLGLSVRTIRSMDAAGKLPKPLRLGHAVRWRLTEIESWLAAGAPDRKMWETIVRTAG